jgi:cinnamyl-alcohol dehydrogenase
MISRGMAAFDMTGITKPFEYTLTETKGKSYRQNTHRLEDEVVLKIACCGICHSDIHTIEQGWGEVDYPCIPGTSSIVIF